MNCSCIGWNIIPQIKLDKNFKFKNHHPECEKYKTEKIGRLFYMDRAKGEWLPAPNEVARIASIDGLSDGCEFEQAFKRVDMTQQDFDNLPPSTSDF